MSWKKSVFQNFKLYAVTDLRAEDPADLGRIEAAYQGGADIIQLRSKVLSDGALFRIGLVMRKLADRYRKLFFVNDRLDLAIALGADGVHLGQDDLPLAAARKLAVRAKVKLWLGKSTHSVAQAAMAESEGADYIGVGPVYETPTKPMRRAVGLDLVRRVKTKIKIPFVAIGGIDENRISEVIHAGARRVAVVRAVFAAERVYETTKRLRQQIEKYVSMRGE